MSHENEVMWACDDPSCDLQIMGHRHMNVENFIKVAERIHLAGRMNRGYESSPEELERLGLKPDAPDPK